MGVNLDKPQRWKSDTQRSVDAYNEWFLNFAPAAYRQTRLETTIHVEKLMHLTRNLTNIRATMLHQQPESLEVLRMATAPPLARDRLIGLAQVSRSLVINMEKQKRLPPQLSEDQIEQQLERIIGAIQQLLDHDIFPWLSTYQQPDEATLRRAATIVADRLCGTLTNPLIRNAQEQRQFSHLSGWLQSRGYTETEARNMHQMLPGSYAFRINVKTTQSSQQSVNVPIDVAIMPHNSHKDDLPLLIEAKSAGDFTNTNKRRKEEATQMYHLRNTYGDDVRFILLLGGYFDSGYLGYEAAEGIDWVWEHRLDDLSEFGL
jgi:hypothetical protein